MAPKLAPDAASQLQAAHLAHELRAPLTSMKLGLELLAEQAGARLAPEERRLLDAALRGAGRLEGLVDDVLDYARAAAGRLSAAPEPCEAGALVDEAVEAMRAAALAKGVRLVKAVDRLLPRCAAEPRRVVQVLVNLISNAVKFTPGRGTVAVHAAEGREALEGMIVFKVKDSGCGLAPEELGRVFDLFAQGSNAHGQGGSGLGLALARVMVELHGGRIWAESWKGGGATFVFTIPVAAPDRLAPLPAEPRPLEVQGLLADAARRLNAVLALFV